MDNHIKMFIHCRLCAIEKPDNISPKDWAQLSVGWTDEGLQVWCNRHECNVIHIDFEGIKHPADIGTPNEKQAKHKWECISPGIYDSTYKCKRCGIRWIESIDALETTKPVHGCKL